MKFHAPVEYKYKHKHKCKYKYKYMKGALLDHHQSSSSFKVFRVRQVHLGRGISLILDNSFHLSKKVFVRYHDDDDDDNGDSEDNDDDNDDHDDHDDRDDHGFHDDDHGDVKRCLKY